MCGWNMDDKIVGGELGFLTVAGRTVISSLKIEEYFKGEEG